mmetsp:Transcript_9488/g.27743  ORF Transcript_9488/g.27743 Transcript_9488/m.27743 type:complete len:100 (-) Transcript_9488:415-714(-)
MFRTIILLAVAVCAQGFSHHAGVRSSVARSSVRMEGARINQMVDLDSEKVVNTVELDGKKVFCRCWKSGTWPLCDASHVKHNKETGDNVGPLIVTPPKA